MSVVGVISMKGGVGKTSTTANIAAALAAKLGRGRVCAIDLDPQNALHWHFGLTDPHHPGVCELPRNRRLGSAGHQTECDVTCIPYGPAAEADRKAFESMLADDPDWLRDRIEEDGLDDNAVVLIDTPPGPSVYLEQVAACADLLLVVLLSDAASYATIPAMETWLSEVHAQRPHATSAYVLNQFDPTEPLSRDITGVLEDRLGKRLAPVSIHADEAVAEALAFQQPVLMYDPHGQASHDLDRLSNWVIQTLNR